MFHQDQPSLSTYMQQPQPINNNYNPQPSFNQNYMQQPMPNPKDITDPTIVMNITLVLMTKAFKLNYSTPTNNNQRISSNPRNRQIAQPGMNIGQDRQMQMIVQNAVQNQGVQNVRNQNGLIVIPGIANQNPNWNGNVVAARTEGNAIRNNEEAGIKLQAEEFDLIAAATDLDEIKEVNANCILMANLHVEQSGGTVDQHPATIEETRAYFESLYNNLVIEVEKINALHLSSGKEITTLNEEISNLNKQLSKEKSTVSSLREEKKKLKSDFKIREDELLDKQIQLENKIKELDNILVKTAQQKQQSLYDGKVLLEKHDPPAVYDSEETLQLAQESRLKMKQLNK
ncbi:hypothetical protein Tco_0879405 [Tanacetum coccineum]